VLNEATLKDRLLRFFSTPSTIRTEEDAREQWTEAYHLYAQAAEDVSGDGVVVSSLGRDVFWDALDFQDNRTGAEAARMFDAAFVAFWQSVTFGTAVLLGVPPTECPNIGGSGVWTSETSSVVVEVREGVLASKLLPLFREPGWRSTAQGAAMAIARAFHEATTEAVFVRIDGLDNSLPVPQPIANVCTVR